MKLTHKDIVYSVLHTGTFLGLQFIGAIVGLILGLFIGFGTVLGILSQIFKVVMCIAFFPNYVALMLTAGELPWEAVAILQFVCSFASVKLLAYLVKKSDQVHCPSTN